MICVFLVFLRNFAGPSFSLGLYIFVFRFGATMSAAIQFWLLIVRLNQSPFCAQYLNIKAVPTFVES